MPEINPALQVIALTIGESVDPGREVLALPIDTVTSRVGIFGISGSGKTHTASVFAEEMLKARAQIVFLDPLGVAWGLRAARNVEAGESPSPTIYIFGGDHADLPLDPNAGAVIADLVVDEGLSLVLDLSHFESDDEKATFAEAFARRLLARNRRPLHVFVDEADLFAAQTPSGGAEFACRKAFDNVVRRGRVNGIGVTLISQRPAVVAKNLLTQVTMLVVHQLTGQTDKVAIDGWIKAHGDEAQRKAILGSLPKLRPGEAWVWAPGGDTPVFERVKIRHRTTFDSSATPVFGGVAVTEPTRLAGPDLQALAMRLAATVEKAAAEDPIKLNERIADLQKQLKETKERKAETVKERIEVPVEVRIEVPIEVRVEVPVLAEADLLRAAALAEAMLATAKDLGAMGSEIVVRLRRWQEIGQGAAAGPSASLGMIGVGKPNESNPQAAVLPVPAPTVPTPKSKSASKPPSRRPVASGTRAANEKTTRATDSESSSNAGLRGHVNGGVNVGLRGHVNGGVNVGLNAGQQRILDALAVFAQVGLSIVAKHNVAIWAGAKPKRSTYRNTLSTLRTAKLIDYPSASVVSLTPAGAKLASTPKARIKSRADLLEAWCRQIPAPHARLLRELHANFPEPIAKSTLATRAGAQATSSTYRNSLSALRTLGLIDYPTTGTAVATALLFPAGLK